MTILAVTLLQCGCSNLAYYGQAVEGHVSLMVKSQSIEALVDRPDTAPELKRKLRSVLDIREFAVRDLGLPDNGSYRSYVDLERRYVVWNVFAAPELSLVPKQWCFPVAGCVSYRGYFAEAGATAFSDQLRQQGYDVYVAGVRAYSTLGWFADPVPSTILELPIHHAARVIFHELAHQQLYVADDTSFNEAFAVAVEREGIRRWLAADGSEKLRKSYARSQEREDEFLLLVDKARQRLAAVYDASFSSAKKRELKTTIIADTRADYLKLKATWGGKGSYDHWFANDLNNAKLASVATYNELVPAFQRLLSLKDGDLAAFYAACEAMAREPPERRKQALQDLMDGAKTAGMGGRPRITRTRVAASP